MAENQSTAPPTSGIPDPFKTQPYTKQPGLPPPPVLLASRIVNRQRPTS